MLGKASRVIVGDEPRDTVHRRWHRLITRTQ